MSDIWFISNTELLCRLILSVTLGGLVGIEREWNNHAAGFRTHILVCLGSTMIMLLSIYGFSAFVNEVNVRMDPARLAAQVISGVGFLGAGAILRKGSVISGLTTAASIWVVAAIGLCVGAGYRFAAIVGTVLVLISLVVFHKVEKLYLSKRHGQLLEILLDQSKLSVGGLVQVFETAKVNIKRLTLMRDMEKEGERSTIVQVQLELSRNTSKDALLSLLDVLESPGIVRMEGLNLLRHHRRSSKKERRRNEKSPAEKKGKA